MTDFIHSFLFQDNHIERDKQSVSVIMDMDADKEGWVGIPHGGIGMGAIMELAAGFEQCTDNGALRYPVSCCFRMGGAGVRVGDGVGVTAKASNTGVSGSVMVDGAAMPYITGDIAFGDQMPEIDEYPREYVPSDFSRMKGRLTHLPHYLNCFVCGVDREAPGLKRRFHSWKNKHGNIVCAFAGFNDEDKDTFYRFEQNGFVHPMALLAVLDETMGWGGFFASENGGVSVRLNYKLLRKISINEKLVFFGKGEKVMGRIEKRMMFWASGCAAVMQANGSFEVVAESSGQWYSMAALTEQMRASLIPASLTENAFAMLRER
jgi:hypothetical protein